MRPYLAIVLLTGLLFGMPPTVSGQIYKYTDENGSTIFVTSENQIPPKYRDGATTMSRPAPKPRPPAETSPSPKAPSPIPSNRTLQDTPPASRAFEIDHTLLYGTWVLSRSPTSRMPTYLALSFQEEGTFQGETQAQRADGSELQAKYSGDWTIQDGMLTCTIRESSAPDLPVGYKEENRIVELNETFLLLEKYGKGNELGFTRQR